MSEEHTEDRGEIIIYRAADNTVQLDVRMKNETVWLTQDQMAMLFGRDKSVIARHIANIYKEQELIKESTIAKYAIVPESRERSYEITLYNLDVIISVGYRVNSQRGVQFRQWASKVLKDYLIKGFAVNEKLRFSDGNKRIAATLFLWFLNNNGILYREDGTKRIADNTLVALTLMIAESRTEEKDTMVKVVVNLINQKN